MHYYRGNKYVLSKCLKQSALMVGSQIKSGREFQTVGQQLKRPGEYYLQYLVTGSTLTVAADDRKC